MSLEINLITPLYFVLLLNIRGSIVITIIVFSSLLIQIMNIPERNSVFYYAQA